MNIHLIDLQARSLRLSEQHGKRSDIARKTHWKLCQLVAKDLEKSVETPVEEPKPVYRVQAQSERRV